MQEKIFTFPKKLGKGLAKEKYYRFCNSFRFRENLINYNFPVIDHKLEADNNRTTTPVIEKK